MLKTLNPHEATRALLALPMTQYELAAIVGCGQSTINKLANKPDVDPAYSIGRQVVDLSVEMRKTPRLFRRRVDDLR